MKKVFPYSRIGRRVPHVFGYDTLWLGADHLLSVHNRRFTEEYRRFGLHEIQAFVICKQPRFRVPVYWFAACFAAFILAAIGTARGNDWLTDSAWTALVLLGIYWVAASMFASCTCHIQTAVGSYELAGLYRSWVARRALKILETKIHEAQGALPEDWNADDRYDPSQPLLRDDTTDLTPVSGRQFVVPALACVALLIDALASWIAHNPKTPRAFYSVGAVLTLVAVILPVIAIVVLSRNKQSKFMRNLLLISVLAVGFANYGNVFVAPFLTALRQQGAAVGVTEYFYWLNEIAEVSLGLVGLLHILGTARRRQTSAP